MASELRLTTLANNAGTESVDTTYVINGSAKAHIYSPATSASISDSFNISSITDGGTGEQDMNLASAMSNANYSSIVALETINQQNTGGNVRINGVHSKTSSMIDARTDYVLSTGLYAGGYENVNFYNMSTHGDLA